MPHELSEREVLKEKKTPVDPRVLDDLFEYGKAFIKRWVPKVQAEAIKLIRGWLKETKYTAAQKEYFYALSQQVSTLDMEVLISKSFLKRMESKLGSCNPLERTASKTYGHPRAINSPSDLSKVIFGAVQWAIDKALYSTGWFVKGTDPCTWADKLQKLFGDNPVTGTDFTSFEAHMTGVLARLVFFWQCHSISGVNLPHHLKAAFQQFVLGTNVSKFKYVTARVHQRMMSGSMWTSSANGLQNLIILSYISGKAKYPRTTPQWRAENINKHFTGLVEGDDGITLKVVPPPGLLDRMGIILKLDQYEHFSRASFCGIVCDPIEKNVVIDPVRVMRNMPFLAPQYVDAKRTKKESLLRSKGASIASLTNASAPIVSELAYHACKITAGRAFITGIWDERMNLQLEKAIETKIYRVEPTVSHRSRVAVESVFGITINDQLQFEASIRRSNFDIRLDSSNYEHADDPSYAKTYFGKRAPQQVDPLPPIVQSIINRGLRASEPPRDIPETLAAKAQQQIFV